MCHYILWYAGNNILKESASSVFRVEEYDMWENVGRLALTEARE